MSNMVLRELSCDQKALGSIVDWARENPPQWDKYTLVAWDLDQLENELTFLIKNNPMKFLKKWLKR